MDLRSAFSLPLSIEAFQEYQQVMNLINQNQIVHGREDSRTFV
jgi:hypothetical protein